MTKFGKIILYGVIIILLVIVVFMLQKKPVDNIPAPVVIAPVVNNIQSVGPLITGNVSDLISFSIPTGSSVSGMQTVTGKIQGGYFFEGNLILKILDANKNVLKTTNGTATTNWMTTEPVDFKGSLDFTGWPAGPAYISIENDNPSGEAVNHKQILVPVVIQ